MQSFGPAPVLRIPDLYMTLFCLVLLLLHLIDFDVDLPNRTFTTIHGNTL